MRSYGGFSEFKTGGFCCLRRNVIIFATNLTLTGRECQKVGEATEKVVVPTFVLKLGTKSILELDHRRCTGCLAGVSSECKYAGCLHETGRCRCIGQR